MPPSILPVLPCMDRLAWTIWYVPQSSRGLLLGRVEFENRSWKPGTANFLQAQQYAELALKHASHVQGGAGGKRKGEAQPLLLLPPPLSPPRPQGGGGPPGGGGAGDVYGLSSSVSTRLASSVTASGGNGSGSGKPWTSTRSASLRLPHRAQTSERDVGASSEAQALLRRASAQMHLSEASRLRNGE